MRPIKRLSGSLVLSFVVAAAAGAAPVAQAAATAADARYPVRTVRLIVPLPAGGPVDSVARSVAQALSAALGQPVVIENKAGANGVIGAQTVIASPADGYTLFFTNNTAVVGAPLLNPSAGFDPLSDLSPISLIGRMSLCIFAHPDAPARSMRELAEYARAHPNALSYATSTVGDVIAAAQFLKAADISMVRVPYKGAAQAIPDLVAGRVEVGIAPIQAGLAHVRSGRLRALAVVLPRRSPSAPEVPTIAEAGFPEVSVTTWVGVFGPARMPGDIVERLSREINLSLSQPELRAQLDRQAFQIEPSNPEGLTALMRQDIETWGRIIREDGITQE